MAFAFALPLGHPSSSLPAPDRLARLIQLRASLQRQPLDFSADETHVAWRLAASAPAWARQLDAMVPGTLARQPDGMLTIELAPDDAAELSAAWVAELPIPRRVSIGPAQAPVQNGRVEIVGAIGTLAGDTLRVGFEDEGGAWIDPVWCLATIDRLGLWSLPADGARPLTQADDAPPGRPVATAFERPAADRGQPMLVITGGVPARRVFNPNQSGTPASGLQVLSNQPLTIGVARLPADRRLAVEVTDRSDPGIRSSQGTWLSPSTRDASFEFFPERDLRPSHAAYRAGGSNEVPRPITYRVRARLSHVSTGDLRVLETRLEQSSTDVLRQAYLFHGPPFQSTPALPTPPRTIIRAGPLKDLPRHSREAFTSSFTDKGPVVDSGALQKGLAWIRRRYAARLFEGAGALGEAEQRHVGADVVVATGWVDPENAERLGLAIDDPAQWSVAMDFAPFHLHLEGRLYRALAETSVDFLTALRAANPAQAFAETTVRLQANGRELWRWTVDGSGVTSAAGAGFSATGGSPTAEAACSQAGAAAATALPAPEVTEPAWRAGQERAARAVTVSVRFVPVPVTAPLVAPSMDPYPAEAARPAGARLLVIVAREAPGVPASEQIPIDVAARTIREALERDFPGDAISVVDVGNPVSLLEELGALRGPARARLRHLFLLSHAWPLGVTLTNKGPDPR